MKILRNILILAIAGLTLSCKKEPEIDVSNKESIEFKTTIETKSYINQIETLQQACLVNNKQDMGIHLYAKKTDEFDKSMYIMGTTPEKKLQFDGSNWTYGTDLVYWGLNSSHDFLGVYQETGTYTYSEATDSYSITSTINTNEIKEGQRVQNDILYARNTVKYDMTEPAQKVGLKMQHALSAITINVKNISSKDIQSLKLIKVEGMITEASSMKIPLLKPKIGEPVQLTLGQTSTIYEIGDMNNPMANHSTTSKKMFGPLIVLPQDFTNNTIKLSFTIHFKDKSTRDVIILLSNLRVDPINVDNAYKYLSGKHYKYNVNIADNEMSLEVKIVPWLEDIIELT